MMKEKEYIKRCQGTSQRGCAMKTVALALCAEALPPLFDLHDSILISVSSVSSVLKKKTAQLEEIREIHYNPYNPCNP